jgi:hypothetical protein
MDSFITLKQDVEMFSNDIRDIILKIESIRGKIKERKSRGGVEQTTYSKIDPVIGSAEAVVMVTYETFLTILETDDQEDLINYLSQLE